MLIKVNLGIGITPMNGFLNIDPAGNPQDPNIVAYNNIGNLDSLVDHNSAELFLCNDVLDYIPLQQRPSILVHYLCKISHQGKIIVQGLDVREVGRAIFYQKLDIVREANALIYGNGKKSLITAEANIDIIMSTNQFEITGRKFQDYNYIIEARRK